MKQQITKKQLGTLSDSGMRALAQWKDCEEFDTSTPSVWRRDSEFLLSIGQMIEFLSGDHVVICKQWDDEWKHWRVGLDWSAEDFYYICEQPELCDALWMAVKEILEQAHPVTREKT